MERHALRVLFWYGSNLVILSLGIISVIYLLTSSTPTFVWSAIGCLLAQPLTKPCFGWHELDWFVGQPYLLTPQNLCFLVPQHSYYCFNYNKYTFTALLQSRKTRFLISIKPLTDRVDQTIEPSYGLCGPRCSSLRYIDPLRLIRNQALCKRISVAIIQ